MLRFMAWLMIVSATPLAGWAGGADEPMLREFSASKAGEYLDAGVHKNEKGCFACHASYAYMMAGPIVCGQSPVYRQMRRAMEQSIEKAAGNEADAMKAPEMSAVQAVMTAAALAQGDRATGGKLHPLTRKALDRMWSFQQENGAWKWAKLNAPPSEIDDHFGVTMAAIAAGVAPEHYAVTPKGHEGLRKVREYLNDHPPRTMHNRVMLMLASEQVGRIMSEEQRKQTVAELLALQRADGGWAMASLGDWKRSDGRPQSLSFSDGYGTGFVTYVLRRAGDISGADPRLQRAITWMKSHQRASGCWFTPSPHKNDELSTYTGTAYVILALHACGEIQATQTEHAQ